MAKEYTRHQQKIISRFYENRESIDQQRLGELVTSLYLATGAKQQAKLWKSAEEAMTRLEIPASRIQHIMEKRDPAILAAVVQDLQNGKL
ncbi:MAG: hypothetical protein R3B90_16315 [Planctomycetaceae bacterium]